MCWEDERMDIMMSRMVMQSIYLYDQVKIAKTKKPGITLTTNLKFFSTGDGNTRL